MVDPLAQADMTGTPAAVAPVARRGRRDPLSAPISSSSLRLHNAIEGNDAAPLRALVGDLHEADSGDLIEALDRDLRPRFVELMGREFDFTALTEVDDAVREDILEELAPETVVEGVRELDSDDAAHILEDLPKQEQAEILEQMPASERGAVERILHYPENSAGRRMQTEFIAVPPDWTVGQTIDHMRDTVELPDRFFELYVVDEGHKLLGAVALDRLLRTKRPVAVADLMDPDRRRVRATEDQEPVARMFERYNLVAAPVVDDSERLVGVLTHDDIVDVIEEEASEDIRALGGVTHDEELADSVWDIAMEADVQLAADQSRHRVPGVIGAGAVRGLAGEDGGAHRPLPIQYGGKPGRQRNHADHDGGGARMASSSRTDRRQYWRVVVRELLVGVVNGLAFAVITGVAAWACGSARCPASASSSALP